MASTLYEALYDAGYSQTGFALSARFLLCGRGGKGQSLFLSFDLLKRAACAQHLRQTHIRAEAPFSCLRTVFHVFQARSARRLSDGLFDHPEQIMRVGILDRDGYDIAGR